MEPRSPADPVTIFRSLDDLPEAFRGGAVSIGNFDGVHLGHARLVERLRAMARRVDGPAVVFTFDPSPTRILRPDAAPEPLLWVERKAEVLAEMGVDAVVVYPTSKSFLELEPREFFDRLIRDRLSARALVEGPNFFFGRHRAGNVEVLRRFCAEANMPFEVAEPVVLGGEIVSSSRVRALVSAGKVEEAAAMLGRPHPHPWHRGSRRRPRRRIGISDGQRDPDRHPSARRRDLRGAGPSERRLVSGSGQSGSESDLRRGPPEDRSLSDRI